MTTLYFCLMFACFTWVAAYPGNIVGKFRMYKQRDRWGNDITTTEDLTPDECAHYCLNMTESHGEYCLAIMFHPYLDGSRRGTCYYKRLLGPMQFLDDGKGCEFYERIANTDDCHSDDCIECLNGGTCVEEIEPGCCIECECPWNYGGDSCETKLESCWDYGDPHYFTFDKSKDDYEVFTFDYQGPCKYLLTENRGADDVPYFRVTSKNEFLYADSNWTYPKYVEIEVYDFVIRLGKANMIVNDESVSYPGYYDEQVLYEDPDGLGRFTIVTEPGRIVRLRTDFDLVVEFDYTEGYLMIKVLMPRSVARNVDGLCRYYDGDLSNEYLLPDGTTASSDIELGNYFQVDDPENPLCPPVVDEPPECDDTLASLIESSNDYCGYINDTSGPFADCIASTWQPVLDFFMDACVVDVCAVWDNGVFARMMAKCSSLRAFAAQCLYEGTPPSTDWKVTAGCGCGYIMLPGACINESNYVVELHTSLDECRAMCDADGTCMAFEHKESRQRCQLSHEGLGTEHLRDPCHVSGYNLYFRVPLQPAAGGP